MKRNLKVAMFSVLTFLALIIAVNYNAEPQSTGVGLLSFAHKEESADILQRQAAAPGEETPVQEKVKSLSVSWEGSEIVITESSEYDEITLVSYENASLGKKTTPGVKNNGDTLEVKGTKTGEILIIGLPSGYLNQNDAKLSIKAPLADIDLELVNCGRIEITTGTGNVLLDGCTALSTYVGTKNGLIYIEGGESVVTEVASETSSIMVSCKSDEILASSLSGSVKIDMPYMTKRCDISTTTGSISTSFSACEGFLVYVNAPASHIITDSEINYSNELNGFVYRDGSSLVNITSQSGSISMSVK